MAVIGKIRQRAGLSIAIVGFSLLAFILGDLLTSNRSFLGGNDDSVGIIGGKKISYQDFESKVIELENNYKLNQNKETIDQATQDQIRDQAWGQFLNDQLLGKQYSKIGINVSAEELFDMVQGKFVHQQIKDAFKDQKTGQFSAANVINFLKNMDNDQTGRTRAQWLAFEEAIKQERISQKYNDLIKMGLYATSAEAKMQYESQGRQASIRYVTVPYNSIPDSTIKPGDSELKEYYNANKNKFKQEASRKVDYVTFDVVPSMEDRLAAEKYISDLVEPFKASTNDSAFVALNSDNKPDVTFYKKGTLSPRLDTIMFDAPIGSFMGTYEENGMFKISKLAAVKDQADSIKVNHILVGFKGAERAPENITRSHEEAKAMADSLLKLCENDAAKYIELAKNNSDDAVASTKDGDLGWITLESQMDPRFKAGAFDIPKGGVKVVESNFGFHLIKVFDMTEKHKVVQVLSVERRIEASTKTNNHYFNMATEFAGKNNTAELFDKACTEQGLNKRTLESLVESEKNIAGLESPREMVRWAFKAVKGEVSSVFTIGEKFAVAKVVEIKEKGTAPLEQVKDQVTQGAIKELKAKQIIEKIGTATTLEAVAQKTGQTVQTVANINFASPYIQSLGMEPAMVGNVSVMKKGQTSKPIKGESGVFVVAVDNITEPAAITDYSTNKKQLTTQVGSRSTYEVFNALKEKANVEDRRGKFY